MNEEQVPDQIISDDKPVRHFNWRRVASFSVKILVSATLILLLVRKADPEQVNTVLASVDRSLIILAAILLALQMMVHVGIWQLIASGIGLQVPARKNAAILLFSLFLNQGFPAALGGIGGRVYFTLRAGAPMGRALVAAVSERFLFLSLLIIVTAAALIPFRHDIEGSQKSAYISFIIVLLLAIGPGMAVLHLFGRRLAGVIPVLGKVVAVTGGIRDLLWAVPQGPGAVLLMAVYHALSLAALLVIAMAAGVERDWTVLLIVFPHTLLAAALPISVNGWGVRELATVTLFGFVGVGPEKALIVSLAFGLAIFVTRVPMALLWFALRRAEPDQPTG